MRVNKTNFVALKEIPCCDRCVQRNRPRLLCSRYNPSTDFLPVIDTPYLFFRRADLSESFEVDPPSNGKRCLRRKVVVRLSSVSCCTLCTTSGSARFWISRSSRAVETSNDDALLGESFERSNERMSMFFRANISSLLAGRRAVSSYSFLGIYRDSGDRSSSDKFLSELFLDPATSRPIRS